MKLETPRLILRDYTKEDFDLYYNLKSDKETMYYLQDIQLFSKEEGNIDFQKVLLDSKTKNRQFYFLHMQAKQGNEPIGSCGYTVLSNTPLGKIVELGYFSYPKFWKNGYMTEAVHAILTYAFQEGDVYRIKTGCLSENIGSAKVMEKNHMIKEATHIKWEWHNGKMKDRVEYRLLKEEWEEIVSIDYFSTYKKNT